MKKSLAFIVPILLAFAAGFIGSYIQSPAIEQWYPTLIKSPLTPPSIVFPIAWSVLYLLMGLSIGVMIARDDMSVVRLWLLQLIVNFLWSVVFFAMRSPLLGLIVILILDVLVFTYTIYAFGRSRAAGWLFIPYLLWLLFATYLTGYIYLHNDSDFPAIRAANPQISVVEASSSAPFTMPELPYSTADFGQALSQESFDYHYGKHLRGYIDNLNRLIVGSPYEGLTLEQVVLNADGAIFNNAAQVWNHTLFFEGLTPHQQPIPEPLRSAIIESFGSIEEFKQLFTDAALSLFGSGWVWLVENSSGELSIVTTANADCPMLRGLRPIVVLDVWEHAYYIDYRNSRREFIKSWWDIIDWDTAAQRYKKVAL